MTRLYAVGLGPGGEEYMTQQARKAMEVSDVICGYTVYVDLVKDLYPGKEFLRNCLYVLFCFCNTGMGICLLLCT